MKKLLYIYLLIAYSVFLGSCQEDLVEKATLKSSVEANNLDALASDSYTFLFENAESAFEPFKWSPSDFGFSASVTYKVQVALAGASFSTVQELGTTQELTLTTAIGEINKALLALGAAPEQPVEVEFRVVSQINDNVKPVYSGVISTTITPYSVVFPPIYMIGGAIGWDLAKAVELVSTGPGEYEGVGAFVNGETFRFFETPSWDAPQINADDFAGGAIPAEFENAGDDDANFRYTGTDGSYAIYINVNTKTITLSPPPTLYIIGSDQGWDLANAFSLTAVGPNTFKGTTTFANGGIWRFFELPDWGATQYNFDYFADGTVPSDLTSDGGGDANFSFGGASGTYEITVSLTEKTITMEVGEIIEPEPEPDGSSLFIIGDDQGWDLASALQLENKGDGVFEVIGNFTNGNMWRLFDEAEWSATQYGYSYFTGGVTGDLGDKGDGDSNFLFNGATGIYKITVDLENKTIAAESATAPTLFVAGDNTSWAFEGLTWVNGGKFTGSLTLEVGNTFRFFGTNDWVDPQYGYSHFTEGSSDVLGDKADPDSNFEVVGAAGTYTVEIDLFGKVLLLSQ
ncbi:SusE domain-containing protein [Flammeovirgaceae bacterium SG7u.111]|nr:SusE domain-containing protein [Flammeovirgaceae bacterium SG7u.132]WPO33680.1 SusE domain-containing protein [Flammeovirgaceae bacterium SG7u.111]